MKPALLLLFDFLLNVVKEIVIKELPQGNSQSVAELLQGNDTGVFALRVKHAVNRGGGYPGTSGKGINGDASFLT